MLYFAYGNNINLKHVTDYLDTHGVTLDTDFQPEHALLHNYRLRTNYFAASHGAGACNIEPAHDHRVEGVVMSITPAIQDVLRVKEGFACVITWSSTQRPHKPLCEPSRTWSRLNTVSTLTCR